MGYLVHDNFYRFNNRNDFIQFVMNCRNLFSSTEEWEEFFGFELKFDLATGEDLETVEEYANRETFKSEPLSFPSIAYCIIEDSTSRFGIDTIRVFSWVPNNFISSSDVTATSKPNDNLEFPPNPHVGVNEDFDRAVKTFVYDSVKNGKDYGYIYTNLHKHIDTILYETEIEMNL